MLKPRQVHKVKRYLSDNWSEIVLFGTGVNILNFVGFPFLLALAISVVCMMLAEIIGDACDFEDGK